MEGVLVQTCSKTMNTMSHIGNTFIIALISNNNKEQQNTQNLLV